MKTKVSVFTPGQQIWYWLLVNVWLLSSMSLWIWWSRPIHVTNGLMFWLTSFVLFWSTIIPGWFLFHAGRGKKPNPNLKPPLGSYAMVVTKAPSEPWSLVKNTLEGMLSQDFPFAYDVWIADENPSVETLVWCKSNGVYVCTRKGRLDYHNHNFPGRTKTKEGNLRFWYDEWGYQYDFVAQLDADHKPNSRYLYNMALPFNDGKVGYVAAPSICNSNIDESWTVRARLWMEAGFHGALQMGYNNGYVPLCIGSHYAVRTKALESLVHPLPNGGHVTGGLAAELAEDHLTTVAMVTNGWYGSFAPQAIAHGDGAVGFGDAMTQEYQWARSLATILIRWWRYWFLPTNKLTVFQVSELLFNQLWYPIFSFSLLLGAVLPIVAVITDIPLMNIAVEEFVWRFAMVQVSGMAPIWFLKRMGLLRPASSPLFSWEVSLFELVRWPWALLGVVHGLWAGISGKELAFKVTSKGKGLKKQLTFTNVAPYLALFVVGLMVTQVHPKYALGYVYFALLTAAMAVVTLLLIYFLHYKENDMLVQLRRRVVFFLLLIVLVMVSASSVSIAKAQDKVPPWEEKFLFGAAIWGDEPQNLYNEVPLIYQYWRRKDAAELWDQFRKLPKEAQAVVITLEPHSWQGWWGMGDDTLLQDVSEGKYDGTIVSHCRAAESLGIPAIIRWGHEMELDRTPPWSGKDPEVFIAAYRHFVDICRRSAPSAFFMWSPAGHPELVNYWPGGEYVDVIGLSALYYEAWNVANYSTEVDFNALFQHRYDRVKQFDKPIMIVEFGVVSEHRGEWLDFAVLSMPYYELLKGVIYFNITQQDGAWGDTVPNPSWRIEPELWPPTLQ